MVDPRCQFRVLYRDFLVRLVDLDVLSAGGDLQKLFVQFAALLGAFNFVVAIYIVPSYATSRLRPAALALRTWGDQEFLIGTTMAVVGMFAVIAWDTVFPDRRDGLVLGTLPVPGRTIFLAKVTAIATGLGVSFATVNIFTGLSYPFVVAATLTGALRTLGAYWVTMAAATLFVFCAFLALQGLAALLLPYRLFLRASSALQVMAFFLVLGVYFVTPGPSLLSVTAPEHQPLLMWFPSFWFLGLFQVLNGPVHPVFGPLATRAMWALAIVTVTAAASYALAYRRTARNIVEQPDFVSGARRPAGRFVEALCRKLLPGTVERAIVLFTARTLARSRQHRGILAAYCGIGLAISLVYAKGLLYGGTRMYAPMRQYMSVPVWGEPNVPLLAAGFVILFCIMVGARAVFALPAALRANWVFQITEVHSPYAYFNSVRKALYGLAGTIGVVMAAVYFAIWPPGPVLAHLVVLALAAIIVIERYLCDFRKVPFACSYLPGKADLRLSLAVYGTLFLFLTDVGTRIEYWSFQSRSRYVVLLAILALLALRARKRWISFARDPMQPIQFEEIEIADVQPLNLARDAPWRTRRYIDDSGPPPEQPWGARLKRMARRSAVAAVVVLAAGTAYEQYGQWRHHRDFPPIGRRVDIGGRSLNLHCSGEGSPTVVFESGAGGPGYAWAFVQREVSRFARACWYDRAGYGWSDPGPFPRHAAAIAQDLHYLLGAASIAPPFVLVGASFGGFCVRVYHGFYPYEVAGMVLADSSHLDDRSPIPPRGEWNPSEGVLRAGSLLAQALRWTGVLRVVMDSDPGPPPKGMTPAEWKVSRSFEPRTLAEHAKEIFLESARQARGVPSLGDRPLIVLTAGLPPRRAQNPVEARQALGRQERWIEIQGQLARLSRRGKQVVVTNSGHCITCDAPEAIVEAVRHVVLETR